MKKINYANSGDIHYYYPNKELSKKFYEGFKALINPKECYDNISHIFLNYMSLESDYPSIKVVYGGIQVNTGDKKDNLYVKHCFFKYQDKIIDPTCYGSKNFNEEIKYLSVIEYSIKDYQEMLLKHKETSPYQLLIKMNKTALELLQKNIILAG